MILDFGKGNIFNTAYHRVEKTPAHLQQLFMLEFLSKKILMSFTLLVQKLDTGCI